MLKSRLFFLVGAIAILAGCASPPPLAQNQSQTTETSVASSAPLSYADYGTVLRTYVNADGLVNYPALQANPQALKDFIAQIGAVSPDIYAAWSENEKIAFLINAYNAIEKTFKNPAFMLPWYVLPSVVHRYDKNPIQVKIWMNNWMIRFTSSYQVVGCASIALKTECRFLLSSSGLVRIGKRPMLQTISLLAVKKNELF
ncbi:MAG: hypothetical protein ACP5RH_16350 [Leptodesmis sp.]|uniref:hypothetical protein n=1 Tax=Leptodesmis sp. TaxID=3100501 RepID=UPI003D0AB3F2